MVTFPSVLDKIRTLLCNFSTIFIIFSVHAKVHVSGLNLSWVSACARACVSVDMQKLNFLCFHMNKFFRVLSMYHFCVTNLF